MAKLISKINSFLDTLQYSRSSNTHSTYKQALRKFHQIVGDDAPLNKDTYVTFLKETGGEKPASRNIYHSAIMGLYMFHAEHDPAINITSLMQAKRQYMKRQGKRLLNFDSEALEKVIAYCNTMRSKLPELRDRAFVLVLADTGLRISEACSLTRGDIDWNEQRALIIGKGDKEGLVHFSNRSIDAMKEYLQARSKLDNASGKPLASLPIFARHDRGAKNKVEMVEPGGMWFAIKERTKQAGIDPKLIRVHDFRHYFVTTVYAATRDLKKAQEWARHESSATTARYAHLIDDSGEAYNKIFNEEK